jgi:beta-glucanase (GH16 family)
MTARFPYAVRALVLAGATACSSGAPAGVTPTTPPAPPVTVTWTLAWSDEFDGAAGTRVDASRWSHDLADGCSSGICGWGNNEKEFYTNAADNISLDGDGHLAIVARVASPGLTCYYGACRYTSAKITTRGKLAAAPGKVEARIKLPAGQGLWPAFWMLGNSFPTVSWPACGELDIMENRGSAPSVSSSAVHGPGYSGNTPVAQAASLSSGTFADAFHTFGVEWNANTVTFYVDGVAHYGVARAQMQDFGASILDQPYFLILNLAVGGNFDGDPRSDAIFPATMLVDYVRVYTATTN